MGYADEIAAKIVWKKFQTINRMLKAQVDINTECKMRAFRYNSDEL